MRRDTDARLAWLAAAGLLAGGAAAWVVSRAGSGQHVIPNAPLALPAALLAGWSFIGSGLLSWQQGPVNRLGPVMVFTGFAWFVSWLPDAADPVLFTIGMALNAVYLVNYSGCPSRYATTLKEWTAERQRRIADSGRQTSDRSGL